MSPAIDARAAMAGQKSQVSRQSADAHFYQFLTSQNVPPNCSLIKKCVARRRKSLTPPFENILTFKSLDTMMLRTVLDSRLFIWALLALPSIPMALALIDGQPSPGGVAVTEMLLHPTGEFSARFLIIAMVLTPMRMLFPGAGFWRWMMKRRRYFGVAAFTYAAFHTMLYIIDMGSLQAILGEALALGIWTGWLAFFVFVPLAVTSNDWSVRRMGPIWKTLQRWVYLAAFGTLLHWIFVHNNIGPALVHFVPLAALETYRIWKSFKRRPAQAA